MIVSTILHAIIPKLEEVCVITFTHTSPQAITECPGHMTVLPEDLLKLPEAFWEKWKTNSEIQEPIVTKHILYDEDMCLVTIQLVQ